MIEHLYILRHGIALPHGTPGIADDERPLTPKGDSRMREIGRAIARLDLDLERIISSPLPRARRTAEIVAEAIERPDLLEFSDSLRAGNGAEEIRAFLKGRSESAVMIVGHNPAFSDLIGLLSLGDPYAGIGELKKGGVASMARTSKTTDRFEIEWIATPRLMRKLFVK